MKKANAFFDRKEFQMAEVEFSPGSAPYTYAVLTRWDTKEGDYLIVPIGPHNTFADANAEQNMKIVKVVGLKGKLNTDFIIKMAIQKVQTANYNKILKLRKAAISN